MKLTYSHFSMNRALQPARVFLLPLVLLTLISFSGTVSFVSAQTTPEVCRQTLEVMKQYERELEAVELNFYLKENENKLRESLSLIRKAITNRILMSQSDIESVAAYIRITLSEKDKQWTSDELLAFHKVIRTSLERKIQEITDLPQEELESQKVRIEQQLKVRKERYEALDCETVLRNRTDTTGTCTLEGSWSQSTKIIGSTVWRITPDGKAKESGIGNAEGTAALSGDMLQINWKTTNGYSGIYQWKLDESCNSGSGSLTFHSGTTGTYSSSVMRQ